MIINFDAYKCPKLMEDKFSKLKIKWFKREPSKTVLEMAIKIDWWYLFDGTCLMVS